jgi:GH25 family lysozyme M1 (1,4-beta-N-acetylmuramidase)
MANILGNDIANFQGDVDYSTYKNNSNFIIFKATEGTGFKDPKFSRNQSEARNVGLALGYYHFARPDLNADANKEADFFLQTLGEIKDGEVLVLDYEPNWHGDAVSWCKAWLDHVTEKTHCKPLIYLNQNQLNTINWKPISDAGYGLWVAAYTGSPTNNNFVTGSWKFAAMQQWTSSQKVPGINGNVDGDVFFGDINTFKKYGYKKPAPQIDPKDKQIEDLKKQIDDIKNEVSSYRAQMIDGINETIALLDQAKQKLSDLKNKGVII